MRKKAAMLILTAVLGIAGAVTASAAFENYYDYMNDDGTYSYYFDEGVTVTMDEDFYVNTFVQVEKGGASFYHRKSYDSYGALNIVGGGKLFTLGACVNSDFRDLPDFTYVGFDEETAMNYYVEFPASYQAFIGDPGIVAEYDALYEKGKEIAENGITLLNGQSGDAAEAEAEPVLTGGWEATKDSAVTPEAEDAFHQAINGLPGGNYEPVALLATQVVEGTNYCLLCRVNAAADAPGSYVLMYIYRNLDGNAEILNIKEMVFDASSEGQEG